MTHELQGCVVVYEMKNATLVELEGKFPSDEADMHFEHLHDMVLTKGKRNFALDLSGVTYFSSIALTNLVALAKEAKGANGRVCLASLSPDVRKTLDLAGLLEIFATFNTQEEAVASF